MKIILPDELAPPPKSQSPNEGFRRFAHATSKVAGSPWTFAAAVISIVVWAACGKVFHFSQNWQLVINTGTTIITFLMVFLIQNTQNRDSKELHIKLDELIRAVETARNTIINSRDLSDEELQRIEAELCRSAVEASKNESHALEKI